MLTPTRAAAAATGHPVAVGSDTDADLGMRTAFLTGKSITSRGARKVENGATRAGSTRYRRR
jgi:hypothetical protein